MSETLKRRRAMMIARTLTEIRTHFEHPPISLRQFDWSAVRDGYEPGDLIGRGASEADAIADLLQQESEK
jgi:hypothetical protein